MALHRVSTVAQKVDLLCFGGFTVTSELLEEVVRASGTSVIDINAVGGTRNP